MIQVAGQVRPNAYFSTSFSAPAIRMAQPIRRTANSRGLTEPRANARARDNGDTDRSERRKGSTK